MEAMLLQCCLNQTYAMDVMLLQCLKSADAMEVTLVRCRCFLLFCLVSANVSCYQYIIGMSAVYIQSTLVIPNTDIPKYPPVKQYIIHLAFTF